MHRRRLACVTALIGIFVLSANSLDLSAQSDRGRRRVPAESARSIEAAYERYAAGDDLAVERWLLTMPGRASLPFVEAVIAGDGAAWSRTRLAFLIEVAVVVATTSAGTQAILSRARIPGWLQSGAALMLERPTAVGSDAGDDAFELMWHQMSLGLAQFLQQYWLQQQLVDAVDLRFIDPAARQQVAGTRVPLARAIAASGICCLNQVDPETIQYGQRTSRRSISADQVVALFTAAADTPSLRAEALVRGAVFLQRTGRNAEALAWFHRVPPYDDRVLSYEHHRSLGRVFDRMGRPTDAVDAYRVAIDHQPATQVARIGLAAALLRSGRPEEAGRVAAEARRMPGMNPADDFAFVRADIRFVEAWLPDLRRLRR